MARKSNFDQEQCEKMIQMLSEDQFRRFVKRCLSLLYKTDEVDIIDGSHDGGNDVAVYINGTRKKTTFQITVQDKIDSKIREDIVKAKDNHIKYGYDPTLFFYYSHTVSGSKKTEYEDWAETAHGITLRIMDRKALANRVEGLPELMQMLTDLILLNIGKGRKVSLKERQREKDLFDILTCGGVVHNIKNEFIMAVAKYFVYDHGQTKLSQIVAHVNEKLNCNISIETFRSEIIKKNSGWAIDANSLCDLSDDEKQKIAIIAIDTQKTKEAIINKIAQICASYNVTQPTPEDIFTLISDIYKKSSEVEAGNAIRRSTSTLIQPHLKSIEMEIAKRNPAVDAGRLTDDLMRMTSDDEYFAKMFTTRLFTNLFKNDRLEEYISMEPKNIILDTPVLMQFISLEWSEEDLDYDDFQYQAALTLKRHIKDCPCTVNLFTTNDYIEEVCVHIWDANNLFAFEKCFDFSKFEQPSNVFYRLFKYMSEAELTNQKSFSGFIEDRFDVDISAVKNKEDFIWELAPILSDILEGLSYNVVEPGYINDEWLEKLCKEYDYVEPETRNKPYRSKVSDLKTIMYLSDEEKHVNPDSGLVDEPYLITNDSTLFAYRKDFLQKHSDRMFWYIYTPLKFANRLSLLRFKPDPDAITYDIINMAEGNFNASAQNKTFIETLILFVGNEGEIKWELARRIQSIINSRKEDNDNADSTKTITTKPVESLFIKLFNYYSKPTREKKDLFDLMLDEGYTTEFEAFVRNGEQTEKKGGWVDFSVLDTLIARRKKSLDADKSD